MNFIVENCPEVKWYTSLLDVESWLGIDLREYDWHFSDIEGAWDELNDPSWVLGENLHKKLKECDYQFSWAVVSAFPKGTKPFTTEKPFADGNADLWNGHAKKQLKSSLFEIVCFDSSATLFIGLSHTLGENLRCNMKAVKELR
ncbi:hypothetical protein M9194_05910 [Vibrio sp. S4M6]|uniref:hypothetical protein n=1 Tax=Vibrio sinus TaxID=2946865 RepID=UPI00202A474F|nr:hypothetical protein [Vibrio sinus]MCL9780966.1 hypothetical protein [Vibrio sinus]